MGNQYSKLLVACRKLFDSSQTAILVAAEEQALYRNVAFVRVCAVAGISAFTPSDFTHGKQLYCGDSQLSVERLDDLLYAEGKVASVIRLYESRHVAENWRQTAVDANSVLDSAVSGIWPLLAGKARLVKSYQALPKIRGNELELAQVISNLLHNSLQSVQSIQPERAEISVRTDERDGRVCIEISDNGSGVPRGVAVCDAILENSGGLLTTSTSSDHRHTVEIQLELATCTEATDVVNWQLLAAQPHKRILIVDDEIYLGRTLKIAFSGQHDVSVAITGRAALALLEAGESFDLILLDLMLPDISGMSLYHTIFRDFSQLVKRVAVMSGGPFDARTLEILAEKQTPSLEKPFRIDQIESLLV